MMWILLSLASADPMRLFVPKVGFLQSQPVVQQVVEEPMFINLKAAEPVPSVDALTYTEWSLVYNALSFGIACMGTCSIFVWLQLPNVKQKFRGALTISGLVTFIACYHYFRIFESWDASYTVLKNADGSYMVAETGVPFNDAYRYVDWLLTVPLLLIELILVMQLSAEETKSRCWSLGTASAVMVALGYPGEISEDPTVKWTFWFLAMIPFCVVVNSLMNGLEDATRKQPKEVQGAISSARWLTIVSWLTYPIVYMVKCVGIAGHLATTIEQVGYSVADIVAKAVFGVMIWKIADRKSRLEK
jgi:bacteriorhodopsin